MSQKTTAQISVWMLSLLEKSTKIYEIHVKSNFLGILGRAGNRNPRNRVVLAEPEPLPEPEWGIHRNRNLNQNRNEAGHETGSISVPNRFRVSSADSAVDIANSFYSHRFIDFTRFQGAGVKIFAATPTRLGTGTETGTRGAGLF